MADVITLFHAERWVRSWEALGGILSVREGPFGADGERMEVLFEYPLPARTEAERQRYQFLRQQIGNQDCRAAALDFVKRRQATRGR